MTGILAIETSTDACSVAVLVEGQLRECYEHAPQQHSQLLFRMLRELLPSGNLRAHGIGLIAYGCGPGSFTGLRIAASAVQGLAYTNGLPVVAVASLAALAQTALRQKVVTEDSVLLCSLDARIKEIYSAVYGFADGLAVLRQGPLVGAPNSLNYSDSSPLCGVGSGLCFIDSFPRRMAERIHSIDSTLLPTARDIIPLAQGKLLRGETQSAQEAQPVYVRDEISWKKIAEQGKRR